MLTGLEDDLTATLIYALFLDKPVYIIGDLNCNLLNVELTETKFLTGVCKSFNLSRFIASPTRVMDSSSLIDVILTSQAKQVSFKTLV